MPHAPALVLRIRLVGSQRRRCCNHSNRLDIAHHIEGAHVVARGRLLAGALRDDDDDDDGDDDDAQCLIRMACVWYHVNDIRFVSLNEHTCLNMVHTHF